MAGGDAAMLFLAVKNLIQEGARLLISVGGVAFSVLLIMSIQGLYQGWSNKIGEYIRTVPADYWVTQTGATDMFHTPSVLPLTVRDFLAGVPGVASAKPFNARSVAFAQKGTDTEPVRHRRRQAERRRGPRTGGRSENVRIGDTMPPSRSPGGR